MKRAGQPTELSSPTRTQQPAKKLRQAPPSPSKSPAKSAIIPTLPTRPPAPALSPSSINGKAKQRASPHTSSPPAGSQTTDDANARVERRKLKKLAKSDSKATTLAPRFFYSNADIQRRAEPVGIGDIRDLVLHLCGDAPPQGWLRVENTRSIGKVVALLVPGITPSLLGLPSSAANNSPNLPIHIPMPSANHTTQLPFMASTFMHACPTRAPGEATKMHSILSSFFMGPVTGEQKRRREIERIELERKNGNSTDPRQYVLSPEQMIDNDYPVPAYLADVFVKPDGWIETPCKDPSLLGMSTSQKPKVYALDCEMCMTEDGKELTRVCVVDCEADSVVYDELIKPKKAILDYLTRFSGITAEKLHPVTKTLADAQKELLRLFSAPSTDPAAIPILLGHSLESDLRAMKLCHPRCIDTALMYHHPRGRPLKPGLAWLTRKWCGREIQTGGEGGHDPEEDARACAELLDRKLQNGPSFGEFKTDQENILERLARAPGRSGAGVRTAVVDYGNPSAWHGAKASTPVACKSDEEVMMGIIECLPRHDFIFGRMIALSEALEWTSPKPNAVAPLPPPPPLDVTISNLDKCLAAVYAAFPPRTAFVLFSGHSDPRTMSTLNARKTNFENALRSGKRLEDMDKADWWSAQEGRDLEAAVELAKKGLLFLCLKDG